MLILNSDESSSDEDQPQQNAPKDNAPMWAQSPALNRALNHQRSLNPDEIFGEVDPLRLEGLIWTMILNNAQIFSREAI
jgi:hypothetical protein